MRRVSILILLGCLIMLLGWWGGDMFVWVLLPGWALGSARLGRVAWRARRLGLLLLLLWWVRRLVARWRRTLRRAMEGCPVVDG